MPALPTSITLIASGIPAVMQRYYDKLFLERLQSFQKYNFLAVPKIIPKNSGRVVYFTRMQQLTTNHNFLVDAYTPTGISTCADSIIATAKPYGAYEQIGRQYELTTLDAGLKEHIENMAQNAGESLDRVLGMTMMLSGNNTPLTANGVEIASITTTDTMSVSGIRTAVAALKKAKAPKWDNGNYRAVLNCDAVLGLQGDTAAGNWINIHMYNSAENAEFLKKGVIGTLYGVDIVETNQAICASATTGEAGAAARNNFFAGKGAVAEVKLQGNGDARVIVKQPGPTDTSNPIDMYSTVGWKVDGYCAKVLNANWLINYMAWGTGTALTGATAEM